MHRYDKSSKGNFMHDNIVDPHRTTNGRAGGRTDGRTGGRAGGRTDGRTDGRPPATVLRGRSRPSRPPRTGLGRRCAVDGRWPTSLPPRTRPVTAARLRHGSALPGTLGANGSGVGDDLQFHRVIKMVD